MAFSLCDEILSEAVLSVGVINFFSNLASYCAFSFSDGVVVLGVVMCVAEVFCSKITPGGVRWGRMASLSK